jgi:CelD/BcsL family acetyltransferase involved in cellulose biosynthesis
VQACDPWGDNAAQHAWERESLDAHVLAFFQTATWARAASAYDVAIGRRPVLLTCHGPHGASFSLPLSIAREGGCKVARILGEQLAEYADAVGPAVTGDGLRAGFALLRRQYRVDLVALRRVPKATALAAALDEIGAMAAAPQDSPWIALGSAGPLPNGNGGRVTGYRLACRYRRALQRKDGYGFEVLAAEAVATDLLRLALGWKKQWIRKRQLVSRVGTEALDDAICRLFTTPGIGAIVGVLRSGGEPVAVETGFAYRDRFYTALRAFRPDRHAQRPGKVALCEMIEWCAGHGLQAFDHGPPADDYKLEWTDRSLAVASRLVPLSPLGQVHGRVFEGLLKPAAQAAFRSLPEPVRTMLLRLTPYAH